MFSEFGWLDTNESQRAKVLEIVQLFKQEGTVDELGIGSIRDTIANALFPGTSVLHTRLRYVLLIPWLLLRATHQSDSGRMVKALRQHEIALISALLQNHQHGVIGQQARERLKRMPSEVYWTALRVWGIRQEPRRSRVSIAKFFQHAWAVNSLNARRVAGDDPEAGDPPLQFWLDPDLPPAPKGLFRSDSSVTFDLTGPEEEYLSSRIAESTKDSLLSWLVTHPPAELADLVWELDPAFVAEFPFRLRRLVDHGRRFHSAIYGAAVLYNLLLAELLQSDQLVDQHQQRLDSWQGELEQTQPMAHWDRVDFWQALADTKIRIHPSTRSFVDQWLDLVELSPNMAEHSGARRLIEQRERQIKGGRARMANTAALQSWSGASGLGRLDYRWGATQSLLTDLYAARTSFREG